MNRLNAEHVDMQTNILLLYMNSAHLRGFDVIPLVMCLLLNLIVFDKNTAFNFESLLNCD